VKVIEQRNYFVRNILTSTPLKMTYDPSRSFVSQAQIHHSRKKLTLYRSFSGGPRFYSTASYLDFTRSSEYQDTFFQWYIGFAPVCRDPEYWLWKKMGANFISGPIHFACSRFEDLCAFSFQNKPCTGLSVHSPDAFANSRTCFSV
jgi:hypothetical protein